jgi:hypothetical protein
MAIGNVSSSPHVVVENRPIGPNELKMMKAIKSGQGTPATPGAASNGTTTAASLLAPPSDDQKAAAKAEDKQQEAFARMKVEMRAKDGLLG